MLTRKQVKQNQAKLFPAHGLMPNAHGPSLTLPEICLDLRMGLNGAGEPISQDKAIETLYLLNDVIRTWQPSVRPEDVSMDAAVYALVNATICTFRHLLPKEQP